MGQERSIKNIVWQLPIASAENNNTGYIHGNAKPHAFAPSDDNLISWSLLKNTVNTVKNMRLSTLKGLKKNTYVKSA